MQFRMFAACDMMAQFVHRQLSQQLLTEWQFAYWITSKLITGFTACCRTGLRA